MIAVAIAKEKTATNHFVRIASGIGRVTTMSKIKCTLAGIVKDHFVPIVWQRISRTIRAIIRTAPSALSQLH